MVTLRMLFPSLEFRFAQQPGMSLRVGKQDGEKILAALPSIYRTNFS